MERVSKRKNEKEELAGCCRKNLRKERKRREMDKRKVERQKRRKR